MNGDDWTGLPFCMYWKVRDDEIIIWTVVEKKPPMYWLFYAKRGQQQNILTIGQKKHLNIFFALLLLHTSRLVQIHKNQTKVFFLFKCTVWHPYKTVAAKGMKWENVVWTATELFTIARARRSICEILRLFIGADLQTEANAHMDVDTCSTCFRVWINLPAIFYVVLKKN